MPGRKFWAHGTTVTFDSVPIEGLDAIGLPDEETGEVDLTDTDSDGAEELVPGLRRNGTLTLEGKKIPGATGQASLRAAREAGLVGEVVITLPPGATDDSTIATITFDAFVTGIGGGLPLVDEEPATVSFALKVTGDITEAVA